MIINNSVSELASADPTPTPTPTNTRSHLLSPPKTNGFPGADFRKFKTPEEATDYANQVDDAGGALSPAPEGWSTMWFDGGCRGNPGPSGAGAVIFNDKDKELYR